MARQKKLIRTENDRKALHDEIARNTRDRLQFVHDYANWLKKTPNKVWSKTHAKYFGGK